MKKIQVSLKNCLKKTLENKFIYHHIFIPDSSPSKDRKTKIQKNFYLSRSIVNQQNRYKDNILQAYQFNKNPFNEASIKYNLKRLNHSFNEKNLVITLYIMTQSYKMDKNEEIIKKYDQYLKIFENNLNNFERPHSLFTILYNLDAYSIIVPTEKNIKFYNFALDFYINQYNFAEEGKGLDALIYLYCKVEHKININKDFYDKMFDFFYGRWESFNVDTILNILKLLISSKYAADNKDRFIKALDIFKFINPYFTFTDFEIVLGYFKKLLSLSKNMDEKEIELIQLKIYKYSREILQKIIRKCKNTSKCTELGLKSPINYNFVNKTIIIKVLSEIIDLELCLNLKNQELLKEYMDIFSRREIVFKNKEDVKIISEYYEKFYSNSPFKDEFRRLIDYITFPKIY